MGKLIGFIFIIIGLALILVPSYFEWDLPFDGLILLFLALGLIFLGILSFKKQTPPWV